MVEILKLEEMDRPPQDLMDASREGKLVLILGAGASITIDNQKPTWQILAELMVEKYEKMDSHKAAVDECKHILRKPKNVDYKDIFSILESDDKKTFWENIREILYDLPSEEKLGLSHILAYLNPLLIITTNWDRLLDSMKGYEIINWKDNFRPTDDLEDDCLFISFLERYNQKNPSILFLHGHISRLDTVLITLDQYSKLYKFGSEGQTRGKIIGFKDAFRYKNDIQQVFSQKGIQLLFFGMNPNNSEFQEIMTSLIGLTSHRSIFVLSSANQVPEKFNKSIKILQYTQDKRELALDFLVKLSPRITSGKMSKKYQVFSSSERKQYLLTQKKLEEDAYSLKYCTDFFTNVFGDDVYLKEASMSYALKKGNESIIKYTYNNDLNKFVSEIYDGMISRRDNLELLIKNPNPDKKIKKIKVLFKRDPKDLDISEINRMKAAYNLCNENGVILQIRWFILEEHPFLMDESPFKDPSMALIIGNHKADFSVALCHASQATDSSSVRFQWVHKDTIFANNRLVWFTRAWHIAQVYNFDNNDSLNSIEEPVPSPDNKEISTDPDKTTTYSVKLETKK